MHERDHRLTLLGRVRSALAEAGVPHALIGAAALALYGVSRSTYDIDLLATERSCLKQAFWASLSASGAVLEVRKGDLDDPLAGVVRFTEPTERPVDLIVGKARWQAAAASTAHHHGMDQAGGAEAGGAAGADAVGDLAEGGVVDQVGAGASFRRAEA
jgi:hypothetical protein